MECKEQMDDCVSAQDFTRAAELKNSLAELEELRSKLAQESTYTEPTKEQHTEKVHTSYYLFKPMHMAMTMFRTLVEIVNVSLEIVKLVN